MYILLSLLDIEVGTFSLEEKVKDEDGLSGSGWPAMATPLKWWLWEVRTRKMVGFRVFKAFVTAVYAIFTGGSMAGSKGGLRIFSTGLKFIRGEVDLQFAAVVEDYYRHPPVQLE